MTCKIVNDVTSKFEASKLELGSTSGRVALLQNKLSEASALLSHDRRALFTKRARMGQLDGDNGGISEIRSVSSNLRKYEATLGITTPHTIDETRPQDLSTYLSKRLAEEEAKSTEGIEPETVRKILTRLKSQVCRTLIASYPFDIARIDSCFDVYGITIDKADRKESRVPLLHTRVRVRARDRSFSKSDEVSSCSSLTASKT